MSRLALVAVLLPAAGPAFAANCQVDPFQLFFGSDGTTHMVVKSGAVCGVSFTQGGRGRTVSAGGVNHLAISEPAAHGRAGTSGMTSWGYAPQKGYVGHDRFVLEVGGEIMAERIFRGTSHITVDVDVVP